jgi:SAM-dependent methyltransferase
MNFCVRPSKSFLFDILEKKLSTITSGIGLDAAAAGLKNRKMFKTDKYFGLDIDLLTLKKGLGRNVFDNTFCIWADLRKLDLLSGDSIDVVVSTNTLYCLPIDKRIIAINNLCRLVSPEGYFFCELVLDKDFKKMVDIMKAKFNDVKIIYYRNIFSRFYEWIFEKDGYLGSHPVAGLRMFRLFAWLLSRLEYLTCFLKSLNKHTFIVCANKKDCYEKKEFDLSSVPLIEKRIYNIMG